MDLSSLLFVVGTILLIRVNCGDLSILRRGNDINYHSHNHFPYTPIIVAPTTLLRIERPSHVGREDKEDIVGLNEPSTFKIISRHINKSLMENLRLLPVIGQVYIDHSQHNNPLNHFASTCTLMTFSMSQLFATEAHDTTIARRRLAWPMFVISCIGFGASLELIPMRFAQTIATCLSLAAYGSDTPDGTPMHMAILFLALFIFYEHFWVLGVLAIFKAVVVEQIL